MATLHFSDRTNAKKLSLLREKGELYRIRRGIYIDTNDSDEVARVLDNQWPDIACYLFGEPVAVARTAAELKPAGRRLYFVSGKLSTKRTVDVGHLKFDIAPGVTHKGVEQFTPNMKRSNLARMCLENLAISRGNQDSKKTLGIEWVEIKLVTIDQRQGEKGLNDLRDEARLLAPILELEKEGLELTKLISAILTSHPVNGVLQTRLGRAQATGEPFDLSRLQRFREFEKYLKPLSLPENPYTYGKTSWRNISFFESYFSNYIEGTEFTIAEAEEIIFSSKPIPSRHEDSHDVSGHMEITNDMSEMHILPTTTVELIDILKLRHSLLLAARPGKRPGEFKEKPNRAGGTEFVLPEHVEGTLVQGFEIYQSLAAGMQRAIFIHFLVSECHPFDDGNGRIARIMMNAELVSQNQFKIIIPTVHRDSYLNGLRKATREGRFRTIVKVIHQLQCYVATLDWDDYGVVKSELQEHAADREPDEGVAIFNKVLSKIGGRYPAD